MNQLPYNFAPMPFAVGAHPHYFAVAIRRAAADPLTVFYPAELASDYMANLGLEDAIQFGCDWARGRITKRSNPEAITNDIAWHRWELRKLNIEIGQFTRRSNVNLVSLVREKAEMHKAAIARLTLDLSLIHRGVA
jgi:hypothetical protein